MSISLTNRIELKSDVASLAEFFELARVALADIETAEKDIAAHRDTINGLEDENVELRFKVAALRDELSAADAKIAKTETDYLDAVTTIDALKSDRAKLQDENADLAAIIATLQDENAKLKAELADYDENDLSGEVRSYLDNLIASATILRDKFNEPDTIEPGEATDPVPEPIEPVATNSDDTNESAGPQPAPEDTTHTAPFPDAEASTPVSVPVPADEGTDPDAPKSAPEEEVRHWY